MIKIASLDQIKDINIEENNVFYIYGKTGSGKTYFIKELVKQNNKEVVFIDFTEIIQNIQNETYINNINNKIIIIDDDIKQIIGKEITSIAIERILIKMKDAKNKIIIISSIMPEELNKINSYLTNFILSEEQIEICYNIENRIKIAEEYAKKNKIEIQKEIIKSIAKEKNLGKIKGKINQMMINY